MTEPGTTDSFKPNAAADDSEAGRCGSSENQQDSTQSLLPPAPKGKKNKKNKKKPPAEGAEVPNKLLAGSHGVAARHTGETELLVSTVRCTVSYENSVICFIGVSNVATY